eukprot:9451701-Alexandrium_andersonii.AAC.1
MKAAENPEMFEGSAIDYLTHMVEVKYDVTIENLDDDDEEEEDSQDAGMDDADEKIAAHAQR